MVEFSKHWTSQAECRVDPDQMFVLGAAQNIAKRVCQRCTVRYECLAEALDNRIEYGVWGGMTERQRRALLKTHPNVPSWQEVFEDYLSRQEAAPQAGAIVLKAGEDFVRPV